MRKILVTSIFATALFSLPLAQGGKAQTQPAVQAPLPAKQNVRITLSTKAKKYAGDENIFLEITLENLGDTAFGFPVREVEEFYQIQFTGPMDRAPQTPKFRVRTSSGGYSVPAHGKIVAYVCLNHVFNVSRTGTYTVKVSTNFQWEHVNLDASADPLTFELTSSPTYSGWVVP